MEKSELSAFRIKCIVVMRSWQRVMGKVEILGLRLDLLNKKILYKNISLSFNLWPLVLF